MKVSGEEISNLEEIAYGIDDIIAGTLPDKDDNDILRSELLHSLIKKLTSPQPEKDDVRPEVIAFARAMELKLQLNDSKGGWDNCTTEWLTSRILQETGELILANAAQEGNSPEDEAVDVANFAMMIWNNIT